MASISSSSMNGRLRRMYNLYQDGGDMESLFLLYYYGCLVTGDSEPNMVIMPRVSELCGFDTDTRYWLAWLWGNFNTLPPCIWVAQEFPHPTKINRAQFERWYKEKGKGLVYAGDRTYVRSMLLEMYDSYISLLNGRSQEDFLSQFAGPNKVRNFQRLWPHLMSLRGFAAYSAYEMSEVLYRCCGVPIAADKVFFKQTRSPRIGLTYVTSNGESSRLLSKAKTPTNGEAEEMEDQALHWVIQSRSLFPYTWPDLWSLESALCTFKKCFGHRRYVGYLLDRSAGEMAATEESPHTKHIDLSCVWKARAEWFHPAYLVELTGKKEPDAEKLTRLTRSNELAGLDLELLQSMEPVYGLQGKALFADAEPPYKGRGIQ